nr:uncharacterized protein LOC107445476 isoform X1 [Parasteatoda tepidariorum]
MENVQNVLRRSPRIKELESNKKFQNYLKYAFASNFTEQKSEAKNKRRRVYRKTKVNKQIKKRNRKDSIKSRVYQIRVEETDDIIEKVLGVQILLDDLYVSVLRKNRNFPEMIRDNGEDPHLRNLMLEFYRNGLNQSLTPIGIKRENSASSYRTAQENVSINLTNINIKAEDVGK